jgi:L-seryl-tRNA(Ser) seleniumtransferase
VIVSRGELIEIGGAFRLPDVMAASGARLREVGTTNRTRLRDYTDAIGEHTRLILKVHPSNYRIVGFTEEPPLSDLVWAAREAGVPLLFDIGSGLLRPEEDVLADEPDGATAIAAGCDLVCFSGDKLLGGPQAGVLAGGADLIERCRRDPVARAVRADKLSLAALEATLWAYARGEADGLPVRRMLAATREQLAARARALTDAVPEAEIIDGESVVGGGSVPGHALPTVLVSLRTDRPERLAAALRTQEPPVFARVEAGRVLIDLRTVHPTDDATLREALARAR